MKTRRIQVPGLLKPQILIVKTQDSTYGVYVLLHEVRELMVLEE